MSSASSKLGSSSSNSDEVLFARRKQNEAEGKMKRAQMELETAVSNQRMAEDNAAALKSSFENQMKDLSRNDKLIFTSSEIILIIC